MTVSRLSTVAMGLVLAVASVAGTDPRIEFHLAGDRVSLRAEDVWLRDILEKFCDVGVEVLWNPALNRLVTVDVTGAKVEDALAEILPTNSYALVWDVLSGPVGDLPRLVSLKIYRSEDRGHAVALAAQSRFRLGGGDGISPPYVAGEILVGFKPGTTAAQVESLLARYGARASSVSRFAGVYRIQVPTETDIRGLARLLAAESIVAAVEPNWVISLDGPGKVPADTGPAVPPEDQHDVERAGKTVISDTTLLAVIDSGLRQLGSEDSTLFKGINLLAPSEPVGDPVGHGTQMALVAAGLVNPEGMRDSGSVLPVLALQAFDGEGNTSVFTLLQAFEAAAEHSARVVSLSWGTQVRSEFLEAAIREALSRDMVIVAAAGNSPTGRPVYPAAYAGVVGVAALGPDGEIWESSNFGNFVDVAAPGRAWMPVGYRGDAGVYAGTSVSCAFVAHVLARYFAAHPQARPNQVIVRLLESVSDAGTPGRDPVYGAGKMDAAAVKRFLGDEP